MSDKEPRDQQTKVKVVMHYNRNEGQMDVRRTACSADQKGTYTETFLVTRDKKEVTCARCRSTKLFKGTK